MSFKLPFYNFLNMLLTGAVFFLEIATIFYVRFIEFMEMDLVKKLLELPDIIIIFCVLASAYEVGLITNRIGAILIEPIVKKFKLLAFNDNYKHFNDCKEKYPIMETLSREYALSRTSMTLFLILSILAISINHKAIALINFLICVVFFLSCKSHSKKIVELMS
jgi:hypothetical protein